MITRIRYVKNEQGLFVGTPVPVLEHDLVPVYNAETFTGQILSGDKLMMDIGPQDSLAKVKKKLRDGLAKLGARFNPEVRNKKKDKQELEKALQQQEKAAQ